MTSVAVLSDIHGVLPVLDAVLAEPDVANADLVVVTGDHLSGPMPARTWARLADIGERCVLVRGNADREIVECADGAVAEHPETSFAVGDLDSGVIEELRALPHPVTVDLRGFGQTVFCHGTPRNDAEVVLVDSRMQRWAEVFAGLPDRVRTVVCGHTHMPFVRLVDRRLVINPGSVGMPYGRAGGSWALLRDGQVSLRHTPIDADRACAEVVAESGYPDRVQWADAYLRSRYSDVDALDAFGPCDGR